MAKYLRIASDLHLEQYNGRDPLVLEIDFLPKDERDAESILVLAGDISSHPLQLILFLRTIHQRFEKIIYVPGNHEFYGHHMTDWNKLMLEELKQLPNVICPFNDVEFFEHSGFSFHLCTLWGDGGKTLEDLAKTGRGLRDFYVIQCADQFAPMKRFTSLHMQELHRAQKAKLKADLAAAVLPRIVVTHHLPSRRLVSDRFWPGDGSDGINGGFVGECDDILAYEELAPKLWIHGHTHDTNADGRLWKTDIRCNPSGYYFENDKRYKNFQPMFVELKNYV